MRMLRVLTGLVSPVTQQLALAAQLEEGMQGSATQKFLTALAAHNPVVTVIAAWVVAPSYLWSLPAVVTPFVSVSWHGYSAWKSCVADTGDSCVFVAKAALMSLSYMVCTLVFLFFSDRVIAKLMSQANESRVARESFLNRISHDLRTPLSAIISYADVMRDVVKGHEQLQIGEDAL